MTNTYSEFSPQKYARIAGIIYLVIIAAGIFGEFFVRGKLVVPGDVVATAANLKSFPQLWRLGISIDLIMQLCDIPVMLIFYVLLKSVNKNMALMNLLFNMIQTAVLVANKLNLLLPLFMMGDAAYLKEIDPASLQVLSYLFIKLHDYGFGVGLIFFGLVCLVEGRLIFKSGFLPKTLGALMQMAGVCYLINSFSLLLFPSLARSLNPYILLTPFIAELSLALWLTIKGVDVTKWKQLAEER
jgi:hypothetical protein